MIKKKAYMGLECDVASSTHIWERRQAVGMVAEASDMSEGALSMYVNAVEAIAISIQMRKRHTDFHAAAGVAQATNNRISANDYHELLNQQLERAVSNSGADMGNIQYFDPQTKALKIEAQYGFDDRFLEFFKSVRSGRAACGTALRRRRPVIVNDVTRSSIFRNTPTLEIMLDAKIRAVSSVPLIGPDGDILGVFSMHYRKPQSHDGIPAGTVLPSQSIVCLMRTFSPTRAQGNAASTSLPSLV